MISPRSSMTQLVQLSKDSEGGSSVDAWEQVYDSIELDLRAPEGTPNGIVAVYTEGWTGEGGILRGCGGS